MAVNIISEQCSLNWFILTSKFQPTCYFPDFSAHPYSINYPVILLLLWLTDQRMTAMNVQMEQTLVPSYFYATPNCLGYWKYVK